MSEMSILGIVKNFRKRKRKRQAVVIKISLMRLYFSVIFLKNLKNLKKKLVFFTLKMYLGTEKL